MTDKTLIQRLKAWVKNRQRLGLNTELLEACISRLMTLGHKKVIDP